MNQCKYCGKLLTLTPEYDTCMECQGHIMREATMPQGGIATNSTQPNMNIYDEALRITKNELNRGCGEYYEYEDLAVIQKALERAKKEHELLELRKTEKKIIECFINGSYPLSKQHIDIIEQIKALEEELK